MSSSSIPRTTTTRIDDVSELSDSSHQDPNAPRSIQAEPNHNNNNVNNNQESQQQSQQQHKPSVGSADSESSNESNASTFKSINPLSSAYKGFHSRGSVSQKNSNANQTVPPLKQPIKPSGRKLKKPMKKSSGIFGKLLSSSNASSRRESQVSAASTTSNGSSNDGDTSATTTGTDPSQQQQFSENINNNGGTRKSDGYGESQHRDGYLFSGRHFSASSALRGSPRSQSGFNPISMTSNNNNKSPHLSQEIFNPTNTHEHNNNIDDRSSPNSKAMEPSNSQIPTIDLSDFSDLSQLVSSANLQELARKNNSISSASGGGGVGGSGGVQLAFKNDHNASVSSNWVPPESWNVKGDDFIEKERMNSTSSSNGSNGTQIGPGGRRMTKSRENSVDNGSKLIAPLSPTQDSSSFTVRVPGSTSTGSSVPMVIAGVGATTGSGPSSKKNSAASITTVHRAFIRIFTTDNSSKVMPCDTDMTTAELLRRYKRKYLFNSGGDYQICVRIGRLSKVLDLHDRPLRLQMSLLLLSGYQMNDVTPATDISYLVKFTIERTFFRQLSDEEENIITRDFKHVNLAGFQIQSIPLVLFQRTFDIESIDVSRNPSISIPLDFIQACNNLTKFIYADNRATHFPTNILQASRLTDLNLEVNFITEIPKDIGALTNLTTLNLACNQLSSLPRSFGSLKYLKSLDLSSNNFKIVPEAISDLHNLVELNLSYNSLSALSSGMVNLTKLEVLNVSANFLTKEAPAFLSNMLSMRVLDIRFNRLSSLDSVSSLPDLQILKSTSNMISTMKDNAPNLRSFFMDKNPLTSLVLQNPFASLTIVDLSKAKLTTLSGKVFSSIPNLERLTLDNNDLIYLPREISHLKKLVYLSAVQNKLQELPPDFGSLTSLQYLDLHLNNLHSLTEEIWYLPSLAVLNISSNLLVEFPRPPQEFFASKAATPVPQEPSTPSTPPVGASNTRHDSVGSISPLNSRRPTQEIPVIKETAQQFLSDSLLFLSLADNRLEDQSVQVLSLLHRLKSLNLSYNDLIELPTGALRRLNNLADLYLSGNKFTTLPSEDFEGLSTLSTLHLNGNKLHSLPSELSKLVQLNVLDVGSNQLKYNISNWPYDWNWNWNTELKFLNFSGNKRLEIKPSHNRDSSYRDLDSFLVLKELKLLGLMDVTITTQKLPDQTVDTRVRTTSSVFGNIGYGISDSLGTSDSVSIRDVVLEKFRGNDEILIGIFDGKNGDDQQGHKISKIVQETFGIIFQEELKQSNTSIQDALRHTFLNLNRDINSIIIKNDTSSFASVPEAHRTSTSYELTPKDGLSGCCATIIYIKDKQVYTANIGDSMAMLTRSNGSYQLLTTEHSPYSVEEYKRIRESGGFVTSDGKLDGMVDVSRAVGFCNLLPHIHSGPDITVFELSPSDQMIAIGTADLWKYVPYNVAVDVIRKEKDEPQIAAEKLRDYAISYGASDKVAAVVISLNNDQSKLWKRRVEDNDALLKVRKDRSSLPEDSTLRRLEDEIEPPVGEVAMVFTDIKSSTLLWDNHPVAMRSAIRTHNTIMRRQLRIVGGYEVKTEGDAFIVSFPTPISALLWCFTVQEQLLEADWPTEILESNQCCEVRDEQDNIVFKGLSVRMGAHWGAPVCERDIITKRMDYFGPMVNRTSRISSIADGGQLFLSSDFMREFNKILDCHHLAKSEDIEKAYGEKYVAVSNKLEEEMNNLDQIGWFIHQVGEKKLKGLETPELITVMFTKSLSTRFKFFAEAEAGEKTAASLSTVSNNLDLVWRLRTLTLRLEEILSYLSEGVSISKEVPDEKFVSTSNQISKLTNLGFLSFLDHVVTRFEALVNMMSLRQQLGVRGVMPSIEVMDLLASSLKELAELKALRDGEETT